MNTPFDASLVWADPVSTEVMIKHHKAVEGLVAKPTALANVKLHATRELERLVALCNRIAWGGMPGDMRRPADIERRALLQYLKEEDRARLLDSARQAAEQRVLVTEIEAAEQQYLAECEARQAEANAREAEQREWAEFEAYDEAEKPKRFAAWQAARRNRG